MNWINVNDKHFVDIEKFEDGSYRWTENNNCPKEPFLVGLFVVNSKTGFTKLEYWLVILSDNGLEEWTEDDTYPLYCWDITDFEFWCPIVAPKTE